MDSLQKAANDYLKEAQTNARWMPVLIAIIALSTLASIGLFIWKEYHPLEVKPIIVYAQPPARPGP